MTTNNKHRAQVAPTTRWYVITEFADCGDYEILGTGDEATARELFQKQLSNERNLGADKVRNITAFQYEIWVDQHYQNEMRPGLAYTVKLVSALPPLSFH